MKLVVLLVPIFGVLCAGQDQLTSFLYTNEKGQTWIEDLTKKPNRSASAADVQLFYFSKKKPQSATKFKCTDDSPIRNTDFDPSKTTLFVVHGWQNSHLSAACWKVKDAILNAHDVNVFLVDWNAISRWDYVIAQAAVVPVGQYVAGFIKLLVKNHKLNLSNVKLVGHSLGAHVMGNAGAALDGQVSCIMGLDPAGPLFTLANTNNRLDHKDAKYVQAIHTNAGILGIVLNVGHADYWPNAGHSQPGCLLYDEAGICSHYRSHQLYAESMRSNRFVSKHCNDYAAYVEGRCNGNPPSSMGMLNADTNARGIYYLTTNAAEPYARG